MSKELRLAKETIYLDCPPIVKKQRPLQSRQFHLVALTIPQTLSFLEKVRPFRSHIPGNGVCF